MHHTTSLKGIYVGTSLTVNDISWQSKFSCIS